MVSASLGYMHLFVDLLSQYLGGPLLHEGSFQGSTTVVWQQVGAKAGGGEVERGGTWGAA